MLKSSTVQQSCGLWSEAVTEPGVSGPDATLPSARQQQAQQFGAEVIGVFDDPVGFIHTPLGVEVLHGRQLRPSNVLSFSTLCNALWLVVLQDTSSSQI